MTLQLNERIDKKAINVWRINALIEFFIELALLIFYGIGTLLWWSLPLWPAMVLLSLVIIRLLINCFIIPNIRMRIWSYTFLDDAILIQSGLIIIKRSRIPMARIQHIDTEHGPIMRIYDLATLTITTAGTVHKIPALKAATAFELAQSISAIAKVRDEDV